MNEKLLLKYLEKRCSKNELNEIYNWMNESHENKTYLFEMEEAWNMGYEYKYSISGEMDMAMNDLLHKIQPATKKRSALKNILYSVPLRVAAVIAVISLLSLNLYMLINKSEVETMNIVEVPRGQRVNLVLSDGTKVWLNSDSRLSYPAKFSKSSREVILTGEGRFDVAKDKNSPFIVHSQDLGIKVLGTVFNVKAYNPDAISVTLESGAIEVEFAEQFQALKMSPNEHLVYSKTEGIRLNKNIDASLSSLWVSGELIFQGVSLKELAQELQRHFDVKIVITNTNIENQLYTCRFKKGVTISGVMDLLKATKDFDYSIEDKKIIIH
ncbi:MAG: FecR family protein [Bacteroidales bacterium]